MDILLLFCFKQDNVKELFVLRERLELSRLSALVPKTSVSTNFTT